MNAGKVNTILSQPGTGVSLHQDAQGGNKMVMSYGNYKARLPSRFPPANVGEFTLRAWRPPGANGVSAAAMMSPLKLAVEAQQDAPQIPTRWAWGPTVTELPGQRIGLDAVRMAVLPKEPKPQPTRDEIMQERTRVAQKEAERTTGGLRSSYDRFVLRRE
jgi:hypothetical protein